MIEISSDRVQELLSAGAQLVEVLPEKSFQGEHLAGAINIPLKRLDAETTAVLAKDRPVIVYCWDSI